jgi:serine/threonine protein kinase
VITGIDSLPLTLGDFRLEEVIGRGGMGVVYRARQLTLDRFAAVKVIAPEHSRDAVYRKRFLREARSAARVEHPHVVPVYQAGEVRGLLYLAMRLVEGPDLKTLLAVEGSFEPARAVRLVCQLADALATAHARGLVHRDVKSRNVLVAGPHAYLVDFGLARPLRGDDSLASEDQWAGTLDYMAPEVLRCGAATPARDIYALGCVLYEVLSGRVPFAAAYAAEQITAHLLRRPPRLALRDRSASRLDAVVQRAMAKSPGYRYPSASHLAHAARCAVEERYERPRFTRPARYFLASLKAGVEAARATDPTATSPAAARLATCGSASMSRRSASTTSTRSRYSRARPRRPDGTASSSGITWRGLREGTRTWRTRPWR